MQGELKDISNSPKQNVSIPLHDLAWNEWTMPRLPTFRAATQQLAGSGHHGIVGATGSSRGGPGPSQTLRDNSHSPGGPDRRSFKNTEDMRESYRRGPRLDPQVFQGLGLEPRMRG